GALLTPGLFVGSVHFAHRLGAGGAHPLRRVVRDDGIVHSLRSPTSFDHGKLDIELPRLFPVYIFNRKLHDPYFFAAGFASAALAAALAALADTGATFFTVPCGIFLDSRITT